MASQLEAFRVLVPEFADKADGTVVQMLSIAASILNLRLIPDDVQGLALVYKAASMFADEKRRTATNGAAASSVLVREKEGDLEKQYSESKASANGVGFRNIYEEKFAEIVPQHGFIMTSYGYAPTWQRS